MPHRIAAKITGVAGYLPPRVMTNADMEKIVDTNDEWIRTRTGIRERHVVDKGMASSHLGHRSRKTRPRQTNTNPCRHRHDHRRQRHSGHALSRYGLPGAGSHRRKKSLGL